MRRGRRWRLRWPRGRRLWGPRRQHRPTRCRFGRSGGVLRPDHPTPAPCRPVWTRSAMIAHSNSGNTPIICDASILPEPLEAIRGKLGVTDGMLDGTMPEVSLQRPGIHAVIGELEAASMAEHVGVNSEVKACRLTSSGNELL